jgi:chromosome segregation ATPase
VVVAAAETAVALEDTIQQLQQKVTELDAQLLAAKKSAFTLEAAKSQVEIEKIQVLESLAALTADKTSTSAELAAIKQAHASLEEVHAMLVQKHEKSESDLSRVQREKDSITAELKEVASARLSLESRVEALQFEHTTLLANHASLRASKAQSESSLENQIQMLKQASDDARMQLEVIRTQHEQSLEAEKKKYSIVATEHEQLRKEHESKSRKLERLEEFVGITKEMNSSLQTERDQLKEQLKAEKETTARLHALVSATHNDSSSLERQVQSAEAQIKAAATQLYKVHCQLFFNIGLALKLDRLHTYGQICNISLQKLWDDVQTLGIDPNQWSVFINAALSAAAQDSSSAVLLIN